MNMDFFPIWAVFLGTIALVLLALESGYQLGQRMRRRSDGEKESPVSAIASSILGMGAFMLAFTFGMSSDRHQNRRALVREEATALRTAWQRSDFLPEGDRTVAVKLLREYVHARAEFARTGDFSHLQEAMDEAARTQDRLWDMAVANARKDMNSDVAALYIDALNQVNAMHAERVAVAVQARIPLEIWLALYVVTLLGMVSVGYQTGIAESKRSISWTLLALSFALVFTLNASLDRPDSGFLKVTQQPLLDLRDAMDHKAGN